MTLAHVFYCELCRISKKSFFTENLWVTASEFVTEMLIFRYSFVNPPNILIKSFLKNPSDSCFCISSCSVYFPSTILYLFKNDATHISWVSIFSAYFVDWEQEWAQYFKLLARSLFSTQSRNFFEEIVRTLKLFSISAKNSIEDVRPDSKYTSISTPLKGAVLKRVVK